jgi:hypothetical protein
MLAHREYQHSIRIAMPPCAPSGPGLDRNSPFAYTGTEHPAPSHRDALSGRNQHDQSQPLDYVTMIATLALYTTRTVTVTGNTIKYDERAPCERHVGSS